MSGFKSYGEPPRETSLADVLRALERVAAAQEKQLAQLARIADLLATPPDRRLHVISTAKPGSSWLDMFYGEIVDRRPPEPWEWRQQIYGEFPKMDQRAANFHVPCDCGCPENTPTQHRAFCSRYGRLRGLGSRR